ncbi:mRNA cleavage and polyadenylation factor CLP1 P-loop domain-containing protein [Giardia muris]|uniref:mRNA cleavage and polyadenylation factor CLP1 P-loop domain-containing protein n=1 Tax=Giardia muris TaxID=5742 RepID=A0A4Z1SRF7_GIAMU|nr:mRNA cleavage and polyadenylation factor CLP1 P-loop domain-containing protein [Giardia muris]|eukprot:TNJ27555.1 mRNA cleavage and polyadenylation factor CLP1 P-loop domain-containing protein [Giardia muris]
MAVTWYERLALVSPQRGTYYVLKGPGALLVRAGGMRVNGYPVHAPLFTFLDNFYGACTVLEALDEGNEEDAIDTLDSHALDEVLNQAAGYICPRHRDIIRALNVDIPVVVVVPLEASRAQVYSEVFPNRATISKLTIDELSAPPGHLELEWYALARRLLDVRAICVIGVQGVGKSTFSRLCVSSKAGLRVCTIYLDLDVLDAHLASPGMVSGSVYTRNSGFGYNSPAFPDPVYATTRVYGYRCISDDPGRFYDVWRAILKDCESFVDEHDLGMAHLVVNTPAWYQGIMDAVIADIVGFADVNALVELSVEKALQIIAPGRKTEVATAWNVEGRETRPDQPILRPNTTHYILQGVTNEWNLSTLLSFRLLSSVIDLAALKLTPYRQRSPFAAYGFSELLIQQSFYELRTSVPLSYILYQDVRLDGEKDTVSTADFSIPSSGLAFNQHQTRLLSTLGIDPGTGAGEPALSIRLSQGLARIFNGLPPSKRLWALHYIFSCTFVYTYELLNGVLTYKGPAFIRGFNQGCPCLLTRHPTTLHDVTCLALPGGPSLRAPRELIVGNLNGFSLNTQVIVSGTLTYGGRGTSELLRS